MWDLSVAHLKNDAAPVSSVHIALRRRRGFSTDLPLHSAKARSFTARTPNATEESYSLR